MQDGKASYHHVCDFRTDLSGKINEADGRFIVRACNNHDAMLMALRRAIPCIETAETCMQAQGADEAASKCTTALGCIRGILNSMECLECPQADCSDCPRKPPHKQS